MCKWGGSGSRKKLREMVTKEELNGSLNPEWEERLMGFPPSWTDPSAPGQPDETLPRSRPDPWAGGPLDWEDGVPRIATGIPDQAKRVGALGQAALPQLGEFFGRLIVEADRQTRVRLPAAAEGEVADG